MPLFSSPDFGSPNDPANIHNVRQNTAGFGQGPLGGGGSQGSMWARMFGASTPTSLVSQREANGGQLAASPIVAAPTPPAGPAATSAAPQQPAGAQQASQTLGTSMPSFSVQPHQAGGMNADMPGIFTGNPNIGVPREQVGLPDVSMEQAMQTFGLPSDPQQQQAQAPQMDAQQQALPPAPVTAGDPWLSDERSFQDMFGRDRPGNWSNWGGGQKDTWRGANYQAMPDFGAPAPTDPPPANVPPTMDTAAPPVSSTAAPPAATGDWFEGLQPGQHNESGFINKNGNPRPWDSVSWDQAKHQGIGWDTYIKNAPDPRQGFWNEVKVTKPPHNAKLPAFDAYQGEPVTLPWDATKSALTDDFDIGSAIPDRAVEWLAVKAVDKARDLQTIRDSNTSGLSAKLVKEQEELEALTAMLSRYGVTFNPLGSGVGDEAPPVVGGGDAEAPGGDPHTPPGDHTPGFDETRNTLNQGDTDLQTSLPTLDPVINRYAKMFTDRPNGMSAEQFSAAMEFARQEQMLNNAMQDKQRGVNILQQSYDQGANDPLRARALTESANMFDDPSGVDWQPIRNRLVSDYDQSTNQMRGQLSQGAARRGLSPGSVAGMQGELALGQGDSLARALGEMSTQEQMMNREGMYRAIQNAGNVNQAFRGADDIRLQMLANAVMGTPTAPQNPYSGMANTAAGIQSMLDMQRAQEEAAEAAKFGWGDAAGLLGGIGGAFLGNPALGSILGGAAGGAAGR